MRVWITKYALSQGILTADSEEVGNDMVRVGSWAYFHKGEWHRSEEAALAHAEELRVRKLMSLDKQTKKISAMKFKVKEMKI